jgi:hypothetical protein
MNRSAYLFLIMEDIDWLTKQPHSLERDHILQVMLQEFKACKQGSQPEVPARWAQGTE